MAATALFTFRRPRLAENYCEALAGTGILDARSGLFLAAPRRTGKSTFLREDLLPALLRHGWTTVYVDLWSNRAADPADLIAAAVKGALSKFNGVITKPAKATGLEKVNVFGALSLNFQALGLPPSVTLLDALDALQTAAGAPVVVVIDEAQHAISTQAGMDAMFALKAARDHLNQSLDGKQKLYLVFTGSNQDKLSRLVLKKAQPFYGCTVSRFPCWMKAIRTRTPTTSTKNCRKIISSANRRSGPRSNWSDSALKCSEALSATWHSTVVPARCKNR